MSFVALSSVSLAFLERKLFHKIELQVDPADRIGLVGPNGSGKTTLLRLITREITPDSGEIILGRGIRVGYLPQDIRTALSGTVLESALDSIPGRVKLKIKITETEGKLQTASDKSDQIRLAGKLAELHQESSYLDIKFPPHEAERILAGLGFLPQDFTIPIGSLSEGWKMRLLLGSLLYQAPDLFLLDEPTNHLDIPSVHWLEQFLETFKGAIILVSHDRDFLNRQINRVISLELEGMRSYRGDYDSYVKARESERLTLEARAKNQEQRIREAQKSIERFRYKATKARQVQSKIKLLKKIELVESYRPQKTIHFSFPPVTRSGREVVAIRAISKAFGHKVLYKDLTLTVLRGERIAIIGPNGSGKTTLLKMVAGEIEPDLGEITLGSKVNMSYFAQHHADNLNPKRTIIEEVTQVVPDKTVGSVRSVCGAFLFSADDVFKTIEVLSGGERARVALAKLLVKPENLMLMDEPTNHLDLYSSEILIDALVDYGGTLIFISHNQSFVNRLATKIWDIGRDTGLVEYPGSLNEYYDHLERTPQVPVPTPIKKDSAVPPTTEKIDRKAKKRQEAENRRLISATIKPIQDKLKVLEERIGGLEQRGEELEKILSDPEIFTDTSKNLPLLNEYGSVREKLKELMGRWEFAQEQLESAKRDLGLNDNR